ncbi:MAG TPA: YjbH domain-containing protein [Candidatus Eisenbacteria bacterium]|nr:YjbH domain-containing protein [Candidatus Eisenbacteria bacterium]
MPLVDLRVRRSVSLAIPLLVLWVTLCHGSTAADQVATALIEHGFENVAVDASDSALTTVWYENRIYRYDMAAMGVAAGLALRALEGTQGVLELVPGNRGVSVVAVSAPITAWADFLAGRADATTFRAQLDIDTSRRRSGEPLGPRGEERKNRPTWRTDLALRPLFGFQLGNGRDPFDYTLQIAPEATMSPFPGGLVTLQAAIRIHDDLDPCGSEDPCRPFIFPGRNTLSWGGWLPGAVLSAVSAGLFPGDRYGVAAELGRMVWKDQLEIWGGGDVSGKLLFLEDTIEYSSLDRWALFLALTHRFRGLDLESTLTVGRFEEEDFAIKFELARRIHEFEIGFFVATNPNSDLQFSPYEDPEDDGESAAGVNLRFALPVARYLSPRAIRPTTVPEFPFTYKSTVEPVAVQITPYDNLDRLRKRLYPTFIWNEIEDLRKGNRYLPAEGSSR